MRSASSIARWTCVAFAALAVVGPVANSEAAATQLFGFNEWASPSNFAIQRDMNMPVRRINVGWNVVQSADSSTWDWTDFDSQYQAIVDAGLKPLIVAVGSPCWSHPSDPCTGVDPTMQPPDPAYDSDWGRFVARLAARYPAAVAVEIWNEPNLSQLFEPHADPERYTDLLEAAYSAVKASNPAMTVISGGLVAGEGSGGWGMGDSEFLQRMYAAGAKGAMDGIGIHTYLNAGGTGPDDPPYYSPAAIQPPLDRLRAVRDAAGDQSTPLWITEAGESTTTQDGYPPGATGSQQAEDLVAAVREVKAMPDVRAFLIHRLADIPTSYGGLFAVLESGYGVLGLDGSPNAAACALSGEMGGRLQCSTLLPNLPPFALGDSVTLTEDAAATTIPVLANDIDVDGGQKTIQTKTNGAHGHVAIAPDGSSVTYTPDHDYCGDDSFAYTLNGGSQATVLVKVTCVDDPTVAVDDSATVDEDTPTVIPVLSNDTDVDGGLNPVVSTTDGAHGTASPSPGGWSVIYRPAANYCNTDPSGPGSGPRDSFTYTLDGGSTATVSVAVSCEDDSPVAVADVSTVTEDAPATTIDVLANDTDVDGGPKSIQSATDAAHGKVVIAPDGSSLTYKPDPNYCSGPGYDGFTYTLNGGSKTAVYVVVNCVDDPTVAVDDQSTVVEDTPTVIPVLSNDTDVDGGLNPVVSTTDGAHGSVSPSPGGWAVIYRPDPNYCNTDPSGPGSGPRDSFTYTLDGGSSATVWVAVTCVDDAPVAVADVATTSEDAPATIDVLANDTDVDGGPKTIQNATDGAHGKVAVAPDGSSLTYTPDPNYCSGPAYDGFTYTLNGGSKVAVYVVVNCVDDPPVAVDDSATVTEDTPAVIPVLANDTDVDSALTVQSTTDPAHGTVSITGGGFGVIYTPRPDYCNDAGAGPGAGPDDTFTYTLAGGVSASVSVVVHCVDDPPVAVNDVATMNEDAPATTIDVLANDTDIDGGPKTVTSASPAVHGAVSVAPSGDAVLYRPDPGYCNTAASGPGSGAPDSFSYMLSGGSVATVQVKVTCPAQSAAPPSTAITSSPPRKTTSRKARFAFSSDYGTSYSCNLDGAVKPCGPSLVVHVSPGRHRLEVWATDSAGRAGTPAAFQWRVKPRKRR